MAQYWPGADSVEGGRLSTYYSYDDLNGAISQFNIWRFQYEYTLKKAWVDIVENGVRTRKYFALLWVEVEETPAVQAV